MNTPAYFCLDTIIPAPRAAPTSSRASTATSTRRPGVTRIRWPPRPCSIRSSAAGPTGSPSTLPRTQVWSGAWNDPGKALGPATGQNPRHRQPRRADPPGDRCRAGPPVLSRSPSATRMRSGTPRHPQRQGLRLRGLRERLHLANHHRSGLAAGPDARGVGLRGGLVERAGLRAIPVRVPDAGPVGAYGTIEIGNVHNLAGKHPNAGGICTGTPFDLDDLAGHPDVVSGTVDLNAIRYVRIVDVPGNGDFFDDAAALHRSRYRAPVGPLRGESSDLRLVADLGFRRLRPGGRRRPPRAGALGRHQPRWDRRCPGPGRIDRRLASPVRGRALERPLRSGPAAGTCSSTAAISPSCGPMGSRGVLAGGVQRASSETGTP